MVDTRVLEARGVPVGVRVSYPAPLTLSVGWLKLTSWRPKVKPFQRRRCTAEVVGVTISVTLYLSARVNRPVCKITVTYFLVYPSVVAGEATSWR